MDPNPAANFEKGQSGACPPEADEKRAVDLLLLVGLAFALAFAIAIPFDNAAADGVAAMDAPPLGGNVVAATSTGSIVILVVVAVAVAVAEAGPLPVTVTNPSELCPSATSTNIMLSISQQMIGILLRVDER